jgi:hypothetical protein
MFGATIDAELVSIGQLSDDAVVIDSVEKDPTNKECIQVGFATRTRKNTFTDH